MWTDKALALTSNLITLVVGHLDLELNVVANVGVLPHQELNRDWVLISTELLMELDLVVLGVHAKGERLSDFVGSKHTLLVKRGSKWLLKQLCLLTFEEILLL